MALEWKQYTHILLGISLAANIYFLHHRYNNGENKNLEISIENKQKQISDKLNQTTKEMEDEYLQLQASVKNLKTKFIKFGPKVDWTLTQTPLSQNEQILIRDPKNLLQKLRNMRKGGLENLQVVTDFDQTITAFKNKGQLSPSTLGAIRLYEGTPQNLKDEFKKNFEKYYPIEQDPTLDNEQKTKYMIEWNEKVAEALRGESLDAQFFQSLCDNTNFSVRHNFKEFIKITKDINLPFFIVSGGMNLFINTILSSIIDVDEYDNLYIHSQKLIFNRNQQLADVHMDVVTSEKQNILNKELYQFQKNTLLFGDSQHDIAMSKNCNSENQLSILFLNEKLAENIQDFYEDGWDIIIREQGGEASFLLPLQLLQFIGHQEFAKEQYKIIFDSHNTIFQDQKNYSEMAQIMNEAQN